MKKLAFLYPGQGSQRIGMGRDLLEHYPPARYILTEAQEILGFDVEKMCLEGPQEKLARTAHLQPILLTLGWIATHLTRGKNIMPQAVAGHSLGEYSALLAAEVIDFPAALQIVKKRAALMEQAGYQKKGAMAAVLGLDTEIIINICNEAGQVSVVNYNCPGQVVISGVRNKLFRVSEKLKECGARKVLPLAVSGAFHSSLMKEAAQQFSSFLERFPFSQPICPLVSNATGGYATSAGQIKDNLKLQMDHPVLWEKSMRLLLDDGFNVFVDVGPGGVLQGLMRRIDRSVTCLGIDDEDSLRKGGQI